MPTCAVTGARDGHSAKDATTAELADVEEQKLAGRRGHSTPRGHEEAGSTRRGLRLRAPAGPAVELLGSAELWVVQELAGTGTAVQVQQVLPGAELLEVPQELAGGELVVLAAAELGVQLVLVAAELGVQQVLAAAEVVGQSPLAGRRC
ncbi:hypothetical protein EJB05_52454, partial [Eragrostis curvula]